MSAKGNKRWVADLPVVVERYNNNVHAETGIPPADVNRQNTAQIEGMNKKNDVRVNQSNVEGVPPKLAVGDTVRLKIMKGAISNSTIDDNWSRKLYTVARVRAGRGSVAETYRVQDANGVLENLRYCSTRM